MNKIDCNITENYLKDISRVLNKVHVDEETGCWNRPLSEV